MDLTASRSTETPAAPETDPAGRCSAVDQCTSAWSAAYAKAIENGVPQNNALRMAAVAYKLQIPKMENLASTKSAFACIAHGISLEVFDGPQASQLLYAAQVASTLYNHKGFNISVRKQESGGTQVHWGIQR